MFSSTTNATAGRVCAVAMNDASQQAGDVDTRFVDELMYKALECEWQRYDSIHDTAGRMIASISLVSVALVSVLPFLIGNNTFPSMGKAFVVEYLLVFAFLLSSLFSAVLLQFRRSYMSIGSPAALFASAKEHNQELNDNVSKTSWKMSTLEGHFSSLNKLCNWMGTCLRISSVLFMIALAFLGLFAVADVVVLLAVL